jgi:hypothetical protein
MRYEKFDLPTHYVLGQHGYTVRPQQGTGLVIAILFEHTKDGTGITEEELLNEARNSSIGQRLITENKCNLTPGHRSNRVKVTLGYLRSKKVFSNKPAVELKGKKLFLTKV